MSSRRACCFCNEAVMVFSGERHFDRDWRAVTPALCYISQIKYHGSDATVLNHGDTFRGHLVTIRLLRLAGHAATPVYRLKLSYDVLVMAINAKTTSFMNSEVFRIAKSLITALPTMPRLPLIAMNHQGNSDENDIRAVNDVNVSDEALLFLDGHAISLAGQLRLAEIQQK